MNADPDLELLRGLQEGNHQAAESFVRRFRPSIFSYACLLLKDRDAAEDATQDVFELVISGRTSVRKVEHVRPWLFQVVRNRCLMMIREPACASPSKPEDGLWDEETPFVIAVQTDIGSAIRSAVGRLKPEYREVLVLREFEDLPYGQISTVIGMPVSTVKFRLFKAREALAQLLAHLREDRT